MEIVQPCLVVELNQVQLPQFMIGSVEFDNMEHRVENAMCHGPDGFPEPLARPETVILLTIIRALLSYCSPGNLDHDGLDNATLHRASPTMPFPCTLVVARTQARP